MKPGALLFLLAVAAGQNIISSPGGEVDIQTCPIAFYGRNYTRIEVMFDGDGSIKFCLKNVTNQASQDCLEISVGGVGGGGDIVTANVVKAHVTPGPALPQVASNSTCHIIFLFSFAGTTENTFVAYIFTFGNQAAILMAFAPDNRGSPIVTTKVGDSTMDTKTFTHSVFSKGVYIDMSSCRVGDVVVRYNKDLAIPAKCAKLECGANASLTETPNCQSEEVCLGNNKCEALTAVCTVTGSTVVDFHSRVHSVQDRCDYTLLKPEGSSDFEIFAGFSERRRKDVSFLEHLIIKQSGVTMYLEQGGRVRVGDQTLNLNTKPQVLHGVELSKDQTGVTAKLPSSKVTVFFDGNTAHVSGKLKSGEGLCGNPTKQSQTTTLKDEKKIETGCELEHKDINDGTINCTRSTKHCDLLKQPPFTACHKHADPEPYVTACKDTLCKYPAVDGLDCQFMEAYAKSCSLKAVTLKDWRSTVKCSAVPQASCLDQHCSDHEFCGERLGERSCLCRALFASKYKPTNALGEPTVCKENSATVSLAGCLLQDKGIDYSILHLKDPNCKGHMDSQTHMVTFSFDNKNTCGTEVSMKDGQILSENTIMAKSSKNGVITRNDQVKIDFSCLYKKPDIKGVSFKIKDSSVVQQIVSGAWKYTLMMSAYTDAGRMNLIGPNTDIQLNQKVWLELKTEGLDANMVSVVTDSCWATDQQDPDGKLRYDLVIGGCPNTDDQTVVVEGNGLGTSNFLSFNMFEFSGKQSEVYLHCKLELCLKQNKSCAPTCSGGKQRKRRSSRSNRADGNPALITMAWSN